MVLAAIDPDGEMSRALRAAGLRVTMPRLAMLTWLDGHPHATVDAIAAGVRERFGAVSTQAVYDMLAACAAAGLLRRIEPAGHPARFQRRVGDHHHHLLCRQCGRTEDVDCCDRGPALPGCGRGPGLRGGRGRSAVLGRVPRLQGGMSPLPSYSVTRRYGSDR